MKYLRPLYRALGATPRTRALAREIFADASARLPQRSAAGWPRSIIAAYPAD